MIKVAVVGTGNIAPSHVGALMTFPKTCRIVALCDIYPEKAEAMKEKFGLDAKVYKDYKVMLKEMPEIDQVHVCTPPFTHAGIAIGAMDAGRNVVVEKPMATSLAECDEMLAAEKRNKVSMACIAQNRFRNGVYKLKRLADSKVAGKICCAHVRSNWWRGHSYYDLWWRGLWEKEGGGPTLNHAVHHIDMLNWIEGKLPVEVTAMLANVMHDNSEVEDISLAACKYDDGSIAEVTSSVIHHGEEQGIELQCADAKLAFPWSLKAEVERPNGFSKGQNEELVKKITQMYESMPDLEYEGHTGEIQNILQANEAGERPFVTGIDGRRTVELITAIYKAGFTKQTVTLPLEKSDPFYTFDGIVKNAPHFYKKGKALENFTDSKITLGTY